MYHVQEMIEYLKHAVSETPNSSPQKIYIWSNILISHGASHLGYTYMFKTCTLLDSLDFSPEAVHIFILLLECFVEHFMFWWFLPQIWFCHWHAASLSCWAHYTWHRASVYILSMVVCYHILLANGQYAAPEPAHPQSQPPRLTGNKGVEWSSAPLQYRLARVVWLTLNDLVIIIMETYPEPLNIENNY